MQVLFKLAMKLEKINNTKILSNNNNNNKFSHFQTIMYCTYINFIFQEFIEKRNFQIKFQKKFLIIYLKNT